MKQLGFLLVLLSIIAMSCQKDYDGITSPYKFLPSDADVVIVVNELNDFSQGTKHHPILSKLESKTLEAPLKILENLNTTKPVYIAFLNRSNTDYIILTEQDSSLFSVDSIANTISKNLTEFNITKTQIDSSVFYHKTLQHLFAASNNIDVLKTLNIENENSVLSNFIETTNPKTVASLIFKVNATEYSKLMFSETNKDNTNYTALDLSFSDKSLRYNGILSSNDSILDAIDCFKNVIPQKTQTINIAPQSTSSLISISYDDFSNFNRNLSSIKQQPIDSTSSFLDYTNEIAEIDNALLLHALDSDMILETIEDKTVTETFRDIDIYEFRNADFFSLRLKPFIVFEDANYFSKYEDFIIFSSSTETLKSIIADALNNNTIANSDAYKNISGHLSDDASIFILKNNEGLSEVLDNTTSKYSANVVQFIYEDNYAHINGIIEEFNKKSAPHSVSELFTTPLDAQIVSPPQTVKNHVNKTHDIVAQDTNNVLYLISSSGNVLWKKQLQGKILGDIAQIDLYKNGKLQLAFATPKRLYVLDRSGNDVSTFPLKFKDDITQPLSVFDYDKRKNYRLLITQGKNLLMYNTKGTIVKGFNYKSNNTDITTQPKHFRIGSKDYIAFATENRLNILNRQGRKRINVKDKIRFSDNELYRYQNKFTSTNTLGQLIQVDTKGRLSTKDLNLPDQHSIVATSKTLVAMSENKLYIKSRRIDLDYGDYTAPKIFYLNDKIYVTTTDLQSKKVYLFDSQAKTIPNFPVFGTSAAELQHLDKDKGLELITQADDKTIVVYNIH